MSSQPSCLCLQTLSRRVFYFRTQIPQIKGMVSLTLVINIPKIPNICGFIFFLNTKFTKETKFR